MKKHSTHKEHLILLRRIEGQIRGVQRMIEGERYCIDILTQLHSIQRAIQAVKSKIFQRHLHMCVTTALKGQSQAEKKRKVSEVMKLLDRFQKK